MGLLTIDLQRRCLDEDSTIPTRPDARTHGRRGGHGGDTRLRRRRQWPQLMGLGEAAQPTIRSVLHVQQGSQEHQWLFDTIIESIDLVFAQPIQPNAIDDVVHADDCAGSGVLSSRSSWTDPI